MVVIIYAFILNEGSYRLHLLWTIVVDSLLSKLSNAGSKFKAMQMTLLSLSGGI
jgi:hypothetical protein